MKYFELLFNYLELKYGAVIIDNQKTIMATSKVLKKEEEEFKKLFTKFMGV